MAQTTKGLATSEDVRRYFRAHMMEREFLVCSAEYREITGPEAGPGGTGHQYPYSSRYLNLNDPADDVTVADQHGQIYRLKDFPHGATLLLMGRYWDPPWIRVVSGRACGYAARNWCDESKSMAALFKGAAITDSR